MMDRHGDLHLWPARLPDSNPVSGKKIGIELISWASRWRGFAIKPLLPSIAFVVRWPCFRSYLICVLSSMVGQVLRGAKTEWGPFFVGTVLPGREHLPPAPRHCGNACAGAGLRNFSRRGRAGEGTNRPAKERLLRNSRSQPGTRRRSPE
jgi:hypothetical protein